MQRGERSAAQSAEVTDGVLVGQALAGDERAFESLVRRYDASLAHCISRYLGDDEQAGDVLQHVWLQLYRSLPTLHTGVPLGPWLLRVARNSCLDELRKRHGRRVVCFSDLEGNTDAEEPAFLATLPDPHPLPEEIAEQHEQQDTLTQAVQALSPRLRAVVLLRCTNQMSFAEIGQALKMPATTAKSSFYRARPKLAALLMM
jgi:RNA polymerase sigma-70 factor, ECF subfamily